MAGEQSHKLAEQLLIRQPKRALPQTLTMYNIGKVSGGLFLVFALVLLWGVSTTNYIGYFSSALACLALVVVPLLFGGILLGLRAGLLNLVEFMCGLAVIPSNMLGGAYQSGRSYQTLALIYSGTGRFNEALKFFQYHENNFNPFETNATSPWNERHRVPELLSRMGREQEAHRCALRNVERSRKDLADFDCLQLRQTLQCDLIVAAMVAKDCGKLEEAIAFLEEASATHSEFTDQLSAPAATAPQTKEFLLDSQTRLLKLHADGLLHMYQERFAQAIDCFSECSRNIKEMRNSTAFSHLRNSELLGFTQYYLGQCYFKSGQADQVPQVLGVMESENKYEPPTSVDKLLVEFTRADYKISQGKTEEALAILDAVIEKISATQAAFDRYLLESVSRYQAILEATDQKPEAAKLAAAIVHLNASPILPAGKNTIQTLEEKLLPAPKLPDVNATARMANRAVFLFLAVLGYTIVTAVMHPEKLDVGSWGALCCITLFLAAVQICDQVNNRRGRALAAQALQRGDYIDVVVSPRTTALGSGMSSCTVDEGPSDLVGRKLELAISGNLIYASQAAQAAPRGKIKARLYKQEDSKRVLAIETLGRVLTVKKPRWFDRDGTV